MSDQFSHALAIIEKYILPHIIDAVNDCSDTYMSSEFNDSWVFGTQFWRNQWNRICLLDAILPELMVNKTKYYFTINGYTFRCHKNDPISGIPNGAKAAKEEARQHFLPGFLDFIDQNLPSRETFLIGVDATPRFGLERVFVGQIAKDGTAKNKYYWHNTSTIYIGSPSSLSLEEQLLASEEVEARPVVHFDKTKQAKNS